MLHSHDSNLIFSRFFSSTTSHAIRFLLNGQLVELEEGKFDPTDSLVNFLRSDEINMKGTKRGCEEGGCGACTVILSSYDPVFNRVKHRAINSCLMPIGNLHNTSISTIERLTDCSKLDTQTQNKLNPIQEAIKKHHATQCGYCSPGFIMSTLAMLLENPVPTNEDLMLHLDGNICRCTGYRSILEALREFTIDSDPNDKIISQSLNRKNNDVHISSKQIKKNFNQEIIDSLKSLSDFSLLKQNTGSTKINISNGNDLLKQPISIQYNEHYYFLPSSLDQLIELKKQNPKAKIIVGNTELLASTSLNDKFDYISTNMVDELKFIKIDNDESTNNLILRIGASTTIDDVFEFCLKDKTQNRVLRALKERISVFASNQTRSVACITGNIAAAGASTDFTNFLPGVDATLKVIDSKTGQTRLVKFNNFFLGRFKTILSDTDIVTEIYFNIDSLLSPEKRKQSSQKVNTDHCFVYKISNRREICGCALSSTIRADISESPETPNIINDIKISFSKLSGVNPIGRAKKAESFLIGKEFTLENIQKSFDLIDEEFPISEDLDDGLDHYRRELSHNLLIKFYHQTQKERGKTNEYDESIVNSSYNSTTFSMTHSKSQPFTLSDNHIPEFSVSCQCNEDGTTVPLSRLTGSNSIGKSVTHLSADLQVQGRAEYTDDIVLDKRAKHAAFVTSTVAHGRIKRINFETDELKKKKFSFFTSHDLLPGANCVGDTQEELLASSEVMYYGQPIAIVVADNEREAWRIARMVEVEYEELPVVTSIEEAVERGAVFPGPSLKHGEDVEEIFRKYENSPLERSNVIVLEGSIKMGGQYHIYMEPNSTVTSLSTDGQFTINPTCKNLPNVREEAAKNLGVEENRIDVRVKRVGGSFCSKSLRSTIVSSATAVASQKLGCQIKMRLPRDVDTRIMSGDHVFLNKYKVCVDASSGKILALKMDFFADAGYWYQSTSGLALKAILHSDSVYKIPNVEVNSHLCQTNKISSAHFRGFGFQNGNLSIEGVMERVSRFLEDRKRSNSGTSLFAGDVKEANFYKTNDRTNYGALLDDVNIDKCWSLVKEKSRYDELLRCVRAFNVVSKNKKRGIALTPLQYGVGQPNVAKRVGTCLVHLLRDGTVIVSHSGVEVGQGINTKLSCLAAKVLDIPVDFIRIERTDTSVNAQAGSTGAGFTNDLTGFALIDACEQLKKRISPYVFEGNSKSRRPFKEVVELAYKNKVDLTAHGFYASPQEGFDTEKMKGRPYQYYEYGAGVALVEIDILTGEQKLLESHIVFDAGQSLNPGIDIGQIEGGFMQGVGWMMTEETKYVHNSKSNNKPKFLVVGKPVNDTMYKYKVPAISNVPLKFSAHLLPDSHNKIGVISSKGVGEPPEILAQCVGFALIDAIEAGRKEIGKNRLTHYDFPLTPDKVKFYLNL